MARQFPRWIAPVVLIALALASSAATRNNDDSCDIAVMPAATLLLPYFEVDLDNAAGETTYFTVTNVTNLDAIARVTLWTDRAYPVFTFNIYLTGYDVQSINLYDVLVRGVIAPDAGTGTSVFPRRGKYSHPKPARELAGCERLPGALDEWFVRRMQSAYEWGKIPDGCAGIGGENFHAIGYATIDVVGNCSGNAPGDPAYWTTDLRYDNVLTGDFLQVNESQGAGQAGPMVHIRAVPEGGTPRERRATQYDAGFARTFYARYQSSSEPALDGRQPLPAQFAARWIRSDADGQSTSLKIWREGRADADAPCSAYAADERLAVREIVTFDEQENATGAERLALPAAARASVGDADRFPQPPNGATSGWMYLNLDRSARDDFASQGWVIASMRAGGRYSVDVEATALGNGCSAPAELTRDEPIAPAPDGRESSGVASTGNDDSCDIALLPAATLLLPYFEVDLDDREGETTLFTITNVSPRDQIARVTLWTDLAYPVVTFNVALTGYDVQSINLYDVLWSAETAPPLSNSCGRESGGVPSALRTRMQRAFTEGVVEGCDNVGYEHENAVGYATIDVVRNCSGNTPLSDEYWTEDITWDNVLAGDYQQLRGANGFAQGAPLVHIRAIPEGGTHQERLQFPRRYDAGFPRTFYAQYQPALAPGLDGRQPLPSVFAARWNRGGTARWQTAMKIWREPRVGRAATCATHDENDAWYAEFIAFDEAENAFGDHPSNRVLPLPQVFDLPATSITNVSDTSVYPPVANGAIGGWMYLNLDQWNSDAISSWVTVSMRAERGYAADFDAAALGNGCSPPAEISEITTGDAIIGPRPNANR